MKAIRSVSWTLEATPMGKRLRLGVRQAVTSGRALSQVQIHSSPSSVHRSPRPRITPSFDAQPGIQPPPEATVVVVVGVLVVVVVGGGVGLGVGGGVGLGVVGWGRGRGAGRRVGAGRSGGMSCWRDSSVEGPTGPLFCRTRVARPVESFLEPMKARNVE